MVIKTFDDPMDQIRVGCYLDFKRFIEFFLPHHITHHIIDKSTGKITPFNQMALPPFVEYRLKPIK